LPGWYQTNQQTLQQLSIRTSYERAFAQVIRSAEYALLHTRVGMGVRQNEAQKRLALVSH
jgi:hypothetical protein